MIESILIKNLKSELGIPVYAEVPKDIKYPFCIVSKSGGNRKNFIYHSMIIVQSYDATLLKAAELNERVIDTMYELEKLKEICSISLNSNANFTDTTNKRYRYQAVFDVYHY